MINYVLFNVAISKSLLCGKFQKVPVRGEGDKCSLVFMYALTKFGVDMINLQY